MPSLRPISKSVFSLLAFVLNSALAILGGRVTYHGDGAAAAGKILRRNLELVDYSELRDAGEEAGDINHRDGLQGDSDEQRALATDDINKEEGARQCRNQFHNAKDGRDKKTFLLASDANQLEEIDGIQRDGTGTRPLREQLHHGGQVDTVQVAPVEEHFLDHAQEADAAGGLELVIQRRLDQGRLADDVVAVGGLVADVREHLGGLVGPALLDEEARRLVLEEHEDEDQAGHDEVQAGGHEPLVVAVVGDVNRGAIVGKVGEDDAEVDGAGEEAGAQAANRRRRNFGNVNGTVGALLVRKMQNVEKKLHVSRRNEIARTQQQASVRRRDRQ